MPKAYPAYPYVEPVAADVSNEEIVQIVEDMLSQNPKLTLSGGGPLDDLCRALNVDVEYSGPPNQVLLDVPLQERAVIWLPRNGKPRHDRMTLATGLGHWLLHIPKTRELHPKCGVQALYTPTDRAALREAQLFAFDLLMPEESFTELWFDGRAQLVAETLNVPTQAVYDRAKWLDLKDANTGPKGKSYKAHNPDEAPEVAPAPKVDNTPPPAPSMGGYARRIG